MVKELMLGQNTNNCSTLKAKKILFLTIMTGFYYMNHDLFSFTYN